MTSKSSKPAAGSVMPHMTAASLMTLVQQARQRREQAEKKSAAKRQAELEETERLFREKALAEAQKRLQRVLPEVLKLCEANARKGLNGLVIRFSALSSGTGFMELSPFPGEAFVGRFRQTVIDCFTGLFLADLESRKMKIYEGSDNYLIVWKQGAS